MALSRLNSTRDFFRVWFTWKTYSLIIFLVIVGSVMLFSYIYTPTYESTAKILILPKSSAEVVLSAGESDNRILPVSTEDINTEIELLTSNEIITDTVRSFEKDNGMALKAPGSSWADETADFIKKTVSKTLIFLKLKEDLSQFDSSVAELKNSIEVEPVAMSNIILVRLKTELPGKAPIILNRLLEIYMTKHNNAFIKEEGIQFLNNQANDYYNKLGTAEKGHKELQKKWDIVDIKGQKESNIELLAELSMNLKNNELAYEEIKSRITISKEALAKDEKEIVITKELQTIPSIAEMEKSIVSLLVTRTEMLKSFNPASREYRDLENQIEALWGEVKKEIIKAVKTDEMELAILKNKQAFLRGKIAGLQKETNTLNERELALTNLEREIKLLENNYVLYASKTENARIYREQRKQDLANVYTADKASIPVKPAFPNRLLMLFVSVITGLFAALGSPFLLEFLDHRLKTPSEVEHILSLPVISSFIEE